MKNPLDEAIERLLKTHRDEKEDILQGDEARKLAERLAALKPDVEFLGSDKKQMGRHARAEERDKQAAIDLDTYLRCKRLHDGGKSWEKAYELVGAEIVKSPIAVKKRCLKIRKLPRASFGHRIS